MQYIKLLGQDFRKKVLSDYRDLVTYIKMRARAGYVFLSYRFDPHLDLSKLYALRLFSKNRPEFEIKWDVKKGYEVWGARAYSSSRGRGRDRGRDRGVVPVIISVTIKWECDEE